MNSYFDSGIEYNRTHPFHAKRDEFQTPLDERNWEWSYLVVSDGCQISCIVSLLISFPLTQRKCRNLELEESYEWYMRRLRIGYLSIFIFIELLVAVTHALLLLTSSDMTYAYIDMIAYVVTALLIWLILSVNFRSELISKHNWIIYASSWLAVSVMVLMGELPMAINLISLSLCL